MPSRVFVPGPGALFVLAIDLRASLPKTFIGQELNLPLACLPSAPGISYAPAPGVFALTIGLNPTETTSRACDRVPVPIPQIGDDGRPESVCFPNAVPIEYRPGPT